MPSAYRPSLADFVGFLAYLFVVDGGRPDVDAVRGAARLLVAGNGSEPSLAPPPEMDQPALLEQLEPSDFEPLIMTSVWMPSPELELATAQSSGLS